MKMAPEKEAIPFYSRGVFEEIQVYCVLVSKAHYRCPSLSRLDLKTERGNLQSHQQPGFHLLFENHSFVDVFSSHVLSQFEGAFYTR